MLWLQVMLLLDRLYQAFDALAEKHALFKVETIGEAALLGLACLCIEGGLSALDLPSAVSMVGSEKTPHSARHALVASVAASLPQTLWPPVRLAFPLQVTAT